jgi:hypothetical protein
MGALQELVNKFHGPEMVQLERLNLPDILGALEERTVDGKVFNLGLQTEWGEVVPDNETDLYMVKGFPGRVVIVTPREWMRNNFFEIDKEALNIGVLVLHSESTDERDPSGAETYELMVSEGETNGAYKYEIIFENDLNRRPIISIEEDPMEVEGNMVLVFVGCRGIDQDVDGEETANMSLVIKVPND